jgi:hypothetical protein
VSPVGMVAPFAGAVVLPVAGNSEEEIRRPESCRSSFIPSIVRITNAFCYPSCDQDEAKQELQAKHRRPG